MFEVPCPICMEDKSLERGSTLMRIVEERYTATELKLYQKCQRCGQEVLVKVPVSWNKLKK